MTTLNDPIMAESADDAGRRRRAGGLIIGAAVISAVAVGALAYTATNAAFTGTTVNENNQFAAATVALTDNDGGTEMFNVSGLIPGDTATDCIEVTYTGTTTSLADLRVFGTSGGALAPELNLTIDHGGAGSSCAAFPGVPTNVYDGALTAFPSAYGDPGAPGFVPTATGEVVAYRFVVELDPLAPDTAQGDTATADFTWEVRSN